MRSQLRLFGPTRRLCLHPRCAVLFFLAYVCVGVFFLMNYMLATVYDAWKTQVRPQHT